MTRAVQIRKLADAVAPRESSNEESEYGLVRLIAELEQDDEIRAWLNIGPEPNDAMKRKLREYALGLAVYSFIVQEGAIHAHIVTAAMKHFTSSSNVHNVIGGNEYTQPLEKRRLGQLVYKDYVPNERFIKGERRNLREEFRGAAPEDGAIIIRSQNPFTKNVYFFNEFSGANAGMKPEDVEMRVMDYLNRNLCRPENDDIPSQWGLVMPKSVERISPERFDELYIYSRRNIERHIEGDPAQSLTIGEAYRFLMNSGLKLSDESVKRSVGLLWIDADRHEPRPRTTFEIVEQALRHIRVEKRAYSRSTA